MISSSAQYSRLPQQKQSVSHRHNETGAITWIFDPEQIVFGLT